MAGSDAVALRAAPTEKLELAAVYRDHAEMVKRWALRLGGPGSDVEDVVHEVFLVAQRRLPEFRGEAKISTWLYRITERIVRKHMRKQRVRGWLGGVNSDVASRLVASTPGPEELMERDDASRIVYSALDTLSRNHRTAVILYELEGLSGEEIAVMMGTKLSTVWVWLHRGRAKFFENLKGLVREGHDG